MNEDAQAWIAVSNREESMARVLSRNGFPEGTALHAHRAARAALRAVLAEHGILPVAGLCRDLCRNLAATGRGVPEEVAEAAARIDVHGDPLEPGSGAAAPPQPGLPGAGAETLDCLRLIRHFVNTALTP